MKNKDENYSQNIGEFVDIKVAKRFSKRGAHVTVPSKMLDKALIIHKFKPTSKGYCPECGLPHRSSFPRYMQEQDRLEFCKCIMKEKP